MHIKLRSFCWFHLGWLVCGWMRTGIESMCDGWSVDGWKHTLCRRDGWYQWTWMNVDGSQNSPCATYAYPILRRTCFRNPRVVLHSSSVTRPREAPLALAIAGTSSPIRSNALAFHSTSPWHSLHKKRCTKVLPQISKRREMVIHATSSSQGSRGTLSGEKLAASCRGMCHLWVITIVPFSGIVVGAFRGCGGVWRTWEQSWRPKFCVHGEILSRSGGQRGSFLGLFVHFSDADYVPPWNLNCMSIVGAYAVWG